MGQVHAFIVSIFRCFFSIGGKKKKKKIMSENAAVCMICGQNDGVLVKIGKRLGTLIDASKLRNDNRYITFESNSNRGLVHENCASAYIESAFNDGQGLIIIINIVICPITPQILQKNSIIRIYSMK